MAEVNLEDQREVRRFMRFLRRRAERPDEPMFVTYADFYGEVVFEDKEEGPDV